MRPATSRALRAGLIALCLLVLGQIAAAGPAAADPSPSPSPSPSGPTASASPRLSTSYPLEPSDFSLTVSPARLAVAGDDLGRHQPVTVVNRGQNPLAITVQKRNFTTRPDGSLSFQRNAPYAAANWVSVTPRQFEVAPGQSQLVLATVDPPPSPEPGDHQVALVFVVPTREAEGNIKINRGVAAPVYLTVPGPTSDTVRLTGLRGPAVSVTGKVDLTAILDNTGNVHRDFRGSTALSVTGAGRTAHFGDFTVPRGATRHVSTSWTPPLVCLCRPTVSFANADGAVQTATVRVVVFPWWLAAAFLIVIAAAVVAIVRSRRGRTERDPSERADDATVGSGDG